ncbi:hypothetical protein Sjap_003206 [Stephania japonica]|uniref:Uncharacterized protein n=1 Tax=Stephania japonica TaxID=461633 RepID=A0AAP0PWV8_9MAGN
MRRHDEAGSSRPIFADDEPFDQFKKEFKEMQTMILKMVNDTSVNRDNCLKCKDGYIVWNRVSWRDQLCKKGKMMLMMMMMMMMLTMTQRLKMMNDNFFFTTSKKETMVYMMDAVHFYDDFFGNLFCVLII